MNIYIKPYLRKIPLIDQMATVIETYQSLYPDFKEKDSFDDFRYQKKTDPVTRFINYVFPPAEILEGREKWIESDESSVSFAKEELESYRDECIKYLIRLFFSVKGTHKVIEYTKLFDLFATSWDKEEQEEDITSTITYDAKTLDIEVKTLPFGIDRDLFCTYAKEFFESLLYFETINIKIKQIGVGIENTVTSYIHHGVHFFSEESFNFNSENGERRY